MNRRDFMQRMFGLTVTIAVGPTIFISELTPIPGTWGAVVRSTVPLEFLKSDIRNVLFGGVRGGGKTIMLNRDVMKVYLEMLSQIRQPTNTKKSE